MIFSTIAVQTSVRLAELGFALMAISGGLVVLGVFIAGFRRPLIGVGGAFLAAGSVLIIIAAHWGTFGYPSVLHH